MPGHGLRIARRPAGTSLPSGSRIAASTPKNGSVADPGLVGVTPGNGEIRIPPVSVCHHVSTIGHLPFPILSRYQIHASGFIGSPTDPSRRKLDKSYFSTHSSPHFINARIAVG